MTEFVMPHPSRTWREILFVASSSLVQGRYASPLGDASCLDASCLEIIADKFSGMVRGGSEPTEMVDQNQDKIGLLNDFLEQYHGDMIKTKISSWEKTISRIGKTEFIDGKICIKRCARTFDV